MYVGEPVTILQHCLQTATLAQAEGAPRSLVLAALFHDVGHLLHSAGQDASARGVDPVHEAIGARYLSKFFGPDVCEPVRLHVAAKRYLCATRPDYAAGLSAESVRSLALQGGPFSDAECQAFIQQPFALDAVRLRRWDDEAKIVGLVVPDLEQFA